MRGDKGVSVKIDHYDPRPLSIQQCGWLCRMTGTLEYDFDPGNLLVDLPQTLVVHNNVHYRVKTPGTRSSIAWGHLSYAFGALPNFLTYMGQAHFATITRISPYYLSMYRPIIISPYYPFDPPEPGSDSGDSGTGGTETS